MSFPLIQNNSIGLVDLNTSGVIGDAPHVWFVDPIANFPPCTDIIRQNFNQEDRQLQPTDQQIEVALSSALVSILLDHWLDSIFKHL